MVRVRDFLPDTGDRDDILSEVVRIFEARQFARSPVMRSLLAYLVEQSVAGSGDRLKAYTIAVDALGRPPNFDAQSDSYPRVQVGRLRRLLADFYLENGVANGLQITIPKGAYAVRFDAADEVRADAASADADDAPEQLSSEPMAEDAAEAHGRSGIVGWAVAGCLAIGLLAAIGWNIASGGSSRAEPFAPQIASAVGDSHSVRQACTKYWTQEKCDQLFGGPETRPEAAGIGG